MDCFEIRIQKPKNPDAQHRCYSHYKRATTVKILVAVEPNGNFCFVSNMYQGGKSDVDVPIVQRSRLLEKPKPGSAVLADRGFQASEFAASAGIIWIVPPSAPQNRGTSKQELETTYKIAGVRIHVERSIGRLKIFQLDGPLPINSLERKGKEILIISHLCKFLPQLVKDTEEVFDEPQPKSGSDPSVSMTIDPYTWESPMAIEEVDEVLNLLNADLDWTLEKQLSLENAVQYTDI